MAIKFKCKDCRHSFQLNKGEDEICPKCKSDNIQPAGNVMSILGKLLLFLVMAIVGYFATDIILKNNNDKKLVAINVPGDEHSSNIDIEAGKETVPQDSLASDGVQTEIMVEESMEPIDSAEFTLANLTLKQDGFSFYVQCGRIPIDYQVELYQLFLNENDAEPILTAEANGEFKSSKYFANDGKYYVKAIFINNNTTTLKPIEGIVKPATPAEVVKPKRMEKDELQKLINEAVANRTNPDLHLWYRGKDKRINTKTVVTSKQEEIKKIRDLPAMVRHGYTQKVKIEVISVSYDNNEVIDAIEIAISK